MFNYDLLIFETDIIFFIKVLLTNASSKLYLKDQNLFFIIIIIIIIVMCKKKSLIASSMQKDGLKFQLELSLKQNLFVNFFLVFTVQSKLEPCYVKNVFHSFNHAKGRF